MSGSDERTARAARRAMNAPSPIIDLRPWSQADFVLLLRLNEPVMMTHLGGPETKEQLLRRHRRYVQAAGSGKAWVFAIVVEPEETPVGGISYWEKTWRGQLIFEMGWSVVPEYQGRGIASTAAAMIVKMARARNAHRYLYAFPSVSNAASNAICRKLGFSRLGECDFECPPGHTMRCNEWRIDLFTQGEQS